MHEMALGKDSGEECGGTSQRFLTRIISALGRVWMQLRDFRQTAQTKSWRCVDRSELYNDQWVAVDQCVHMREAPCEWLSNQAIGTDQR